MAAIGGYAPKRCALRTDHSALRLAAKASDRAKAAERLWPAFERRLLGLGYSPRSIAHAYSILSGPGHGRRALRALERDET